MAEYHGHKTMPDGSHVPLTKDEAEAIWLAVEEERARRAEDMPTARDALATIVAAQSRLHELGWRLGGGLGLRAGDACAVAESGSTGMWHGRLSEDRQYVHYSGCVSEPRKCWLKPLAELTDEERAHMDKCDRRNAEMETAMIRRFGEQSA